MLKHDESLTDKEKVKLDLYKILRMSVLLSQDEVDELTLSKFKDASINLDKMYTEDYEEKLEDIPEEVRDEFEKAVSLRVIDNYWMEHISTMSHLRDGIGLRGYANTSPLQAYTMEGYQLFDEMIARINKDIIKTYFA